MRLGASASLPFCLGIVAVAWFCALSEGSSIGIAGAAVITLLCAAALQPRPARRAIRGNDWHHVPAVDESSEFRRGVFDLCAALKLGIGFCERHLNSEPDLLLRQLERMSDNISSFVNRLARPVHFVPQRRWPWHLPGSEEPSE